MTLSTKAGNVSGLGTHKHAHTHTHTTHTHTHSTPADCTGSSGLCGKESSVQNVTGHCGSGLWHSQVWYEHTSYLQCML